MTDSKPREIILEVVRIGASLRVTAVDAETGTEVVFQAPAQSSQFDIRHMALNKLRYVMNKEKE